MHVSVRVRVFLARHRWVYWTGIGALAAAVGLLVHVQLQEVDAARSAWGTSARVWVADGDQAAGGAPAAIERDLPEAMVPSSALSMVPPGAVLRQRVADGEVFTTADIAASPGPASGAAADTVVVGIIDPLARGAVVGSRVQVTSEGIVLAADAEVVSLADEIVFVAVEPGEAPMIAAAAQSGLASIVFVP